MKKQLTANFHFDEFQSKDGAPFPKELIDNLQELANNLQVLRDYIGVPLSVISGYRSEAHNKKVGGVKNSSHRLAKAADLRTLKHTPKQLAQIIEHLILTGRMKQGGIGVYKTFVHYDIRDKRARW